MHGAWLWPRASMLVTSCGSLPSLPEQQLDPPQKERLGAALAEMDQQLRKLADTPWLCQPVEPGDEEVRGSQGFRSGTLAQWLFLQHLQVSVVCAALGL